MSQREQILAYLQSGGVLTPLKALEMFSCLALSQRCGELRREGHKIHTMLVPVKSRGRVKYVASYALVR